MIVQIRKVEFFLNGGSSALHHSPGYMIVTQEMQERAYLAWVDHGHDLGKQLAGSLVVVDTLMVDTLLEGTHLVMEGTHLVMEGNRLVDIVHQGTHRLVGIVPVVH